MKITYLESAAEFLERAGAWLVQREAEHQLLLGVAGDVARRAVEAEGAGVPAERRAMFLLVENEAGLQGAGVMTPPHRAVLTDMGEAAMRALGADMARRGIKASGVVAELRGAAVFAEVYARGTRQRVERGRAERLYELRLEDWRQPVPTAKGEMVRAGPADLELATAWAVGFLRDALDTVAESEAAGMAANRVTGGRLFFWKVHDRPAAMAAWARPSARGIAVNAVYTPPELRRRGYATALVARLSKYLLTGVEDGGLGKKFCVLYTDLANPTSNSIYQKMGYRPVCDQTEMDFHAASETSGA